MHVGADVFHNLEHCCLCCKTYSLISIDIPKKCLFCTTSTFSVKMQNLTKQYYKFGRYQICINQYFEKSCLNFSCTILVFKIKIFELSKFASVNY